MKQFDPKQHVETLKFLKFVASDTTKYIIYVAAIYALFIGSYYAFV